ncbi:hypothetical protein F5H01DRAFT_358870 [Linnemannia elongata]|nr:hypothetical protein F5H01DRAFT_358870 [Linnemannia elongata]
MADAILIVIAVISAISTLASAIIAASIAGVMERYPKIMVVNYHNPLFLATQHLQSSLHNIRLALGNPPQGHMEEDPLRHICFLVGQYFSWTYIFHCQAHFLYKNNTGNRKMKKTMDKIQQNFCEEGWPFFFRQDEQLAIGETMTDTGREEPFSIGYSTFYQRFTNDATFRNWFQSLYTGINTPAPQDDALRAQGLHKLEKLEHLLLDLIQILDPKNLLFEMPRDVRDIIQGCPCSKCT